MSDLSNYNRGTLYLNKGNYLKALQFLKREHPKTKECYLNIGNALRKLGRESEALTALQMATSVEVLDFENRGGLYAPALCNLGLQAYSFGADRLAVDYYRAALDINPLTYDAIWNLSTTLLRIGCSGYPIHKDAWKMYEYRFKAVKAEVPTGIPRWDGISHVSRLVVLHEQGYGDKIMMGRYLKQLASFCDELFIWCDPKLGTLFDYPVAPALENFNASIPFGCLAERFSCLPESGDYLLNKFPGLDLNSINFNIAIEYNGSPTHTNNKNRSCHSNYFTALGNIPGVQLYNIRPDAPRVKNVKNLKCNNWAESANAIAAMDLVISVDTSLVHLAGSLGVETWMIQPLQETDFRWGNPLIKLENNLSTEWNPWYSSVKVIENPGWDTVFESIKTRLLKKLSEKFVMDMLVTELGNSALANDIIKGQEILGKMHD